MENIHDWLQEVVCTVQEPSARRQSYVVGFVFCNFRGETHVGLVRKERPAWQKGSLNGPGGKIEKGEYPAEALARELFEKIGLHEDMPKQAFAYLQGNDERWEVYFFKAWITEGQARELRAKTDEEFIWYRVSNLVWDILDTKIKTVSNLAWLILAAMDTSGISLSAVDLQIPKL